MCNTLKGIKMEPTLPQQAAAVFINGKEYEASGASEEAYGLIQDISTIQSEMNKLKVSYDIANLARMAILEKTQSLIDSGNSGLVEIVSEEDVTVEDTPETA